MTPNTAWAAKNEFVLTLGCSHITKMERATTQRRLKNKTAPSASDVTITKAFTSMKLYCASNKRYQHRDCVSSNQWKVVI